jgi:hypothetical protein
MAPSLRPAVRAFAIAGLLPAAALVTACSSSAPPAPPSPSVHSPSGPGTAPASNPAPSSPAPATSPVAAQQPPHCSTSALQAKTGTGQGAAGSTYVPIVFTNISAVTCTLYGYPGVSLAAGSPVTQIGLAATKNSASQGQLVTLGPGAQASALLRIVSAQNFPATRCHLVNATYLQVYPPNQTTPIYVPFTAAACSKPVHLLTVDVVHPGLSD